jgi:hypothetical protein
MAPRAAATIMTIAVPPVPAPAPGSGAEAKIRHVAGPRGVSSFLNEAARERLARLELRGLLDELDAKHGAAPAAVRAEIARDARRIFRTR